MKYLEKHLIRENSVDKLSRNQVEAAILYIDYRLKEELDNNLIVRYCALKVDLINRLMQLDQQDDLLLY